MSHHVRHVAPSADLVEHDTSTEEADCLCGPDQKMVEGGWIIVHHSLDGRERQEARQVAAKKQAHPGFKKAQGQIAKRMGVSEARAGAILASSTRKASPAAKRRNPRLKRVKGAK